ncbi:uncharacterized protein LACBIDRAFT_313195 [Laccaria bicolor S238N-H82]|uniref:Predicted protein n=1 Tax=Laccaria bicolor (strain S238N-H82 / ATCC MYA-4686) TaxID=486041 RepID=B0DXS0_LACBS|nr:uncharacterized protein LACBIDRAFT_313195 [Laccaria bicolor S238N-H82]EDR00662.1 predicted protein [Laccaria bicolor S238N-H82]|eukprot:XP_001888671.1 predicted protein [Laccaria bicolor S238N-H82]
MLECATCGSTFNSQRALGAHKSTCQKPKEKVNCQYCNLPFNTRGIGAHQTSCRRKHENDLSDKAYEKKLRKQEKRSERDGLILRGRETIMQTSHQLLDIEALNQPDESSGSRSVMVTGIDSEPAPIEIEDSPPLFSTVGNPEPYQDDEPSYEIDDIKTEYHPHSGRSTQIDHFEEYGLSSPKEPLPFHKYGKPWYPFTTRKDFEFAEIILKSQMKEEDVNGLLRIFQDCRSPDALFTLKSHQNIKEIWKEASHMMTPRILSQQSIGQLTTTSNSITETSGIGHWIWQATPSLLHTLSGMHSGYINRWWKIQSRLPPDGKPFCIILYADKAKLSSFGTEKAYPVIARCANLPDWIRNGEGIGGGRVVGWQPIVLEDETEKGKKAYVDFKTVVWHESFRKLLESIRDHSKLGFWFKCGDDIIRRLFALILILSADYEEQCVMALIRGKMGLCPCPVCLVPFDKLSDASTKYPLRTAEESKATVDQANECRRKDDAEEILKKKGLRGVQNSFWDIENSDPHHALSFDRMHNNSHGLGGRHILKVIREDYLQSHRSLASQADSQMNALPRWRNLIHFSQFTSVNFTDATKFEDIMKMLPFVAHNILTESASPEGFRLLKCARAYLNVDMYAALEVQTSETIAAGRREVAYFSKVLKEYEESRAPPKGGKSLKNWSFPKRHALEHIFDDIEEKGATKNTSTKPNEKMHGPLREIYLRQTNFKDVVPQILTFDHWRLISLCIRERIDVYDASHATSKTSQEEESEEEVHINPYKNGKLKIGAKQPPETIHNIEMQLKDTDVAFKDFRKKLIPFLNQFCVVHNIPR